MKGGAWDRSVALPHRRTKSQTHPFPRVRDFLLGKTTGRVVISLAATNCLPPILHSQLPMNRGTANLGPWLTNGSVHPDQDGPNAISVPDSKSCETHRVAG